MPGKAVVSTHSIAQGPSFIPHEPASHPAFSEPADLPGALSACLLPLQPRENPSAVGLHVILR